MLTTRSHNGFWQPSRGYPTELQGDDKPTSTAASSLVYEVNVGQADIIEDECVSASELMELWSDSEADQALVQDGRRWVADTLYRDQPATPRVYRLHRGLSQAQLATRAATSQPHIARIESGSEDIRLSTARKIADALEISLEQFEQAINEQRRLTQGDRTAG
jgi:DNA-binding XRE family transcriptional regulator